jgi:hypothetical protein
LDTPAWTEARTFDFAHMFLWEYNHNATQIVFLARFPVALLSLMLGALVYRWAGEVYGVRAGLLALVLYALAPNILAHARLATTDLGLACVYLIASYGWWRYLRTRTLGSLGFAGMTLGIALASKLTALLLLPVSVLVTGLYEGLSAAHAGRVRRGLALAGGLVAAWAIALVTVWALYGFQVGSLPTSRIAVPAAPYITSVQALQRHTQAGHQAFLMGAYSLTGWWTYFPVALAIKTPVPTLLLTGLAGIHTVLMLSRQVIAGERTRGGLGRAGTDIRDVLALWIPSVALFAAAMAISINLGYRYILPALPFAFILGGGAASRLLMAGRPGSRRWRQTAQRSFLALLGVWYLLGSLRIYPHYLAYFNELVGGPNNGYRYLVDSNLDWGQDLPGLKQYVDRRALPEVKLAWFGTADPAYYGIPYDPLPSKSLALRDEDKGRYETFYSGRPAPGVYAISVTHLQGVYFEDHDLYAWFRERTPSDRIGYSIMIYDVEPSGAGPVTLCLDARPLIDVGDEIYARLDTNDVAVRWCVPDGTIFRPDSREVWVIGPRDEAPIALNSPLLAEPAMPIAGLSSVQGVALRPVTNLGETQRSGVIQRVAERSEVRYPSGEIARLPLDVGHIVDFLGYEAPEAAVTGHTAQWTTYWRVKAKTDAHLKLFLHVLDGHGEVIAQQDPNTVPPGTWEPGDILIHVLGLRVPKDTPPGTYSVRFGWYEAETGQRLTIFHEGQETGDHLLLRRLQTH